MMIDLQPTSYAASGSRVRFLSVRRALDLRRPLPAAVLTLAAVLRFALISGYRFHPDEALYATWARLVATGQDVWLVTRVVDKPPLFIYTLSAFFRTFGASEEIARIPNELASIATVALTYLIARELYDARVALVAELTLALSPLAFLFAPTAFTDPSMLMWLLAAMWLGLRRRFGLSGLAFGLALVTKQDAILFAPLLAFFSLDFASPHSSHDSIPAAEGNQHRQRVVVFARKHLKVDFDTLRAFVRGCALPLLVLAAWAALRPAPDFLTASLDHYGGLSLMPVDEYGARAGEWLRLALTTSSDWLLLLTALVVPVVLWRTRSIADVFLSASIAYWLLLHVVLSFPAWDRYVLPLAPLVSILVARSLVWLADRTRGRAVRVTAWGAVLVLLALPARAALAGGVLVGRDFDMHAGVEQVGTFFWNVDTTATILYERELSWELDYYTFGRELDRRWMPDLRAVADDARHMPLAQRYIALGSWEATAEELTAALDRVNLRADIAYIVRRADGSPSVYLYLLTPKDLPGSGHASTAQSDFLCVY